MSAQRSQSKLRSRTKRGLLCGALLLGACASPQKIYDSAQRHELRAAELEAQGNYKDAAKERAAAQKEREKAATRSYYYY